MPLTKDDLRKQIISQGENPDDFNLDSALTELNTPTPSPAPEVPTRGQAFAKVGKRSILPSLIGGGAGAVTLAALAPETGGLSLLPLAASGLVGAGSSYLASRGQESLLKKIEGPENYQKDVEEYQKARETYPVQSFATEAAPMLLQGRPSLSFGKNLITGGGKLLAGKALEEGEKLALKEGATLAGVNTGVDLGAQTLEGGDISPGRAALAGLTGLAFTKPQLLGKTRLFGYREPQEAPAINPSQGPQQMEFPGLLTSPKITPKLPAENVEQTQPSGKVFLPPADRETFGIPPKDQNPIPPKAVEESSGQQIIKPIIDQSAPAINPESAEALPPIADKITPIVPREGFTAKQEFELKGPGHLEISRGLDKLETDKVLSPERSALLRDILHNTDDNHLAQITLKTRANLGSSGKAGAQVVGDNFYNKFMEFRKGLADLPSVKDTPRQEPLKVFLHEFAHIGYNYSHILTPADKQLVVDRFNQLKQSGRLEYFRQGLSDKGTPDRTGTKGTGIYYYAKSPDEFIAESFAEHVLGHRISDESLKGVIGKLYDSFVGAIKRVAQRVGFNNIETDLRPIFEKILKGKELPTAPVRKTVSEGEGKLLTTDEAPQITSPEEEENTFKSVEELSKLDPKSFFEKARGMEGGYTREAIRIGQKITDVKPLEEALVKARTDFQKAIDLKDIESVGPLANKVQFFREALEAATGQGGIGEMLKNEAAKTSVKSEDTIEEGERPFITETELQLQQDRPLGLTPAKDGSLPVLNLRSKLERTVPKDEWGALKDAGIEEYLKGKSRISVGELTKWIRENGPKLEIKKLSAQEKVPSDPRYVEFSRLQHEWYDKFNMDIRSEINAYLRNRDIHGHESPEALKNKDRLDKSLSPGDLKVLDKYTELHSLDFNRLDTAADSDSATSRFTMVNPKPLDKMPGAVDILVRVPVKRPDLPYARDQYKYEGYHFGSSDRNIVGWVRGYMETSPTGEKIFHVFEVQSDWAQQRRFQEDLYGRGVTDESLGAVNAAPNDPALANYESLALKAAIQHAIKEGATKIAISDAETAMMTEGHDRNVEFPESFDSKTNAEKALDTLSEQYDVPKNQLSIEMTMSGRYRVIRPPQQSAGMRLHYDQTLPNILKKITGDKGEVTSFGPHQNAYVEQPDNVGGLVRGGHPRNDLIFKNSQGQPKTDITARVYDLSNVKSQVDSRPARMFSTHYDDIIQNEAKDDPIAHEISTVIKPNSPAKEITLGPLTSSITKLEQMGGSHAIVGKAFREFFRLFSNEFEGKYVFPIVNTLTKEFRSWSNLILKPKEWILQDNASNQKLRQYFIDMRDKGASDIQLTPAEEPKRDTIRSYLVKVREDQNSKGIPVWEGDNPRAGGFDPNWFPDVPNMAALDTVINRPHTPEGQKLIKDFIDHQNAKDRDGQKVFNEFLDSFGSAHQPNIASQYGPIDKAQGVGLPDSWREKNLVNIMARYAKRVARRFAYNDAIESSPEVRSALGIKKDPQGNDSPPIPEIQRVTGDTVSYLMRNITGQLSRGELKRDTAGAIVRAAMLGPYTGAADFTSNLTLGLQHSTPVQTIKSIASAWKDISSNLTESYKAGVNRLNIGSLETNANGWGEMISAGHRFRDIINELQGRNLLERYSRATAFGMGKFIAMDNLWKASRGSLGSQGRKFLDDFSPGWEQYKQSGEFPPEVLNKIAAEYTGSVQGNYDPRGLPAIAMEGSLSPFLALSRWNIEKANNFAKYVITPLVKDKNPWPFINSTIGMILGGTAVTELRKLMTGHEEKTPTKEEITEGFKEGLPNTGKALGYKMAALADASGYAGLLGNLARNVGDILFKNKPQGFTNPLIYAGSEAFDLVSDAVQALNDGEFEIGVDTIEKIVEQYVQAVRIANGVFAQVGLNPERAKELDKADKMRNLRMYNNLAGYPVNEISQDKPNPFTNINARSYKQSSDLQESSDLLNKEILPSLIQKYKDNPEMLRAKLSGLAQNSYQTLPSPELSPLKASQYLSNQEAIKGKTYRDSLVQDYLRQKLVNSIKSSAVPRL